MKKGLLIVVAIVLAPVVLGGLAAVAAGDWRPIGSTPNGDQVSVSSVSSRKNGVRSAWIKVEYKQLTKLPQGGPFVELRAHVRFNCNNGSALVSSEWFYSTDHGKLVVSKKTRRDDQFGQPPEGNFGDMARDFVCKSNFAGF